MYQYNFSPTPYGGAYNRYGMGRGHRWFDFSQPSPGGGPQGPATADSEAWWMSGGSDGGDVADTNPGHHGTPISEMTPQQLRDYMDMRNNGNVLQRNIERLNPSGLIGALFGRLEQSQLAAALNAAGLGGMNPGDYVDGKVAGAANTGMNVAGGVPNPELMGRGDPSQDGNEGGYSGGGVSAADLGADLAAGNSTGNFANGGKVKGLPPPRFVKGNGDGRSDSVPGGKYRLSAGEVVMPADVVSAAGRGSSEAGAKQLGSLAMMLRRQHMNRMGALPPPAV